MIALHACARSIYWEDPFSQGESYRAPAEKAQFEAEVTRHIEVGAAAAPSSILPACTSALNLEPHL